MTPLRPAPASYDRTLALTTWHYRAPSFGTVDHATSRSLQRMRKADDGPDGITRCAGCGHDAATLVRGFCLECQS